MAAPFKRICCRTAHSGASTYRTSGAQLLCPKSSQWQRGKPLSSTSEWPLIGHGNRTFTSVSSQSAPPRAQRRRRDEEASESQQWNNDNAPEYSINEGEISSTGHAELEQHMEIRKMVRTAAWQMPLLTQLAKPFEAPDNKQLPLRWRYTTYMGDSHPASRKVVVEFSIDDIAGLTEKQKLKMQKLVGTRLNPETNTVRMNCESFQTQAQNKRYLGDTIQKLLAEVRDPNADSFEDVPLDTRHHRVKKRLEFPEEWKLTPERKALLDEKRKTLLLEEGKRVEDGDVVSGIAAIEAARQLKVKMTEEQPVPVEQKRSSR